MHTFLLDTCIPKNFQVLSENQCSFSGCAPVVHFILKLNSVTLKKAINPFYVVKFNGKKQEMVKLMRGISRCQPSYSAGYFGQSAAMVSY